MESLKDRKIAVFLMIIMIVLGTVFGSHRSLGKLYNSAKDVFYNGEKGDGFSIQHDLDDRFEESLKLVKIAEKYPSLNNKYIDDVKAARDKLKNAGTIKDKSKANSELDAAVFALYNELGNQKLSSQDEKYRTSSYGTFSSYGDTISHNSYNSIARKFNNTLNKFPANLLGRLTGIQELDTF